jgi:ABC-type amino acid transport substrate-binding protein
VVAGGKKEPAPAPAATAPAPAPAKVYVVGTDAAYAPFESQNEKGEIVGFDIDVVRYFTPVNGNTETRDDEVFSTTYTPSDTVICTNPDAVDE